MSKKKHKKSNEHSTENKNGYQGLQKTGLNGMLNEEKTCAEKSSNNTDNKVLQAQAIKAEDNIKTQVAGSADRNADAQIEVKQEKKPVQDQKAMQTEEAEQKQKTMQAEKSAQEQKAMKDEKPEQEPKESKSTSPWRMAGVIILVVLLAFVVVALLWYGDKVNYYEDRYLQNTYINGVDCSEMTADEVAVMLDDQAAEYTLVIKGRNEQGEIVELGSVAGQDIAMALTDSFGATEDILLQQDEWMWIKSLSGDAYSYSIQQGIVFDEKLLRDKLSEMEAFQEENMIAPTDAYIGAFSEKEGAYELVAHTDGTMLDVEAVIAYVEAAIYGNGTSVDLEELECYSDARVTAEDKDLLKNWEEINQWLKTDITYDWNDSEVKVDISVVKNWVSLKDGQPVLDRDAVAAFVEENALQYDTYGKKRTITTTHGAKKTLPSGAFGWKTDVEVETAELITLIKKGAVTEREPVYSSKAPAKGVSDIGNSYVEADLTNQHLYLYYKGKLVMETDFVSGDMRVSGNITPQGVFGLTYKTRDAVLRGANYETPVSYWMPFHGNFGMHDATWRTEFGGDIYLTNGSHGCLNLPLEKAAELYSYLYTGYPVICYY